MPAKTKATIFPLVGGSWRKKGYIVHIPYRGLGIETNRTKYPSRRWVVEQTGRWVNLFRELKIRYCRKAINYEALVQFANATICFRMTRLWL